MNKLKRACAGLLAIFLMAISLSVLAPPRVTLAASPPSIWGDKNTSYGNNIKRVEARTDRPNFYLQIDRVTTDGREDYFYKTDSSEYSTTYEPRLVTFESGDGTTLTADICQPKQILIQSSPDDDVGTKPYRYYFNEYKTTSIDNFRDKMIEYNKQHPNYFWGGHTQLLESTACNNAKPIDLTPLANRRLEAVIDFQLDSTTQNKNDLQATTKGLTAEDLLKQLYVCPYHRISGEIVKTFDGQTPACVKIGGMSVADILDDNNNTVKTVSWNTPDLTAGDYGILVFGIGSDKFNRPFNFGDTGDGTYKTYATGKDSDLKLDFAAILREARARGDNFKKDTAAYEAIPDSQRLTDTAVTNPKDDELTCETRWNNPLTYVMCPMVKLTNELIVSLDKEIVKQLNIKEDDYFKIDGSSQTGNSFYGVWSNFRTIGLVLLVIAALVMVVSQALSVGPFDAYTVKKVLPRILVAIIFMTLSWDICRFLIALSNDAGLATRAIIQTPFSSLGNADVGNGSNAAAFVASLGGLTLGLWGILSFAATAALAVIIAFFVLIIRKMVIVFLVLLAPFAIACYILPNTQKAYKFWWDTFSKGLLMFPIVMGFIAVGRSFAKVSGSNQSLPGVLITLIAYFGPYFALPMAFRMAGGAIATISGMANDRGKGAFDRLKKFRGNQSSQNVHKMKTGDRFQGNTALARQFNRRSAGVAGGWRGAHFGFGARGEAYHDLHGRAAAEDAIKNNPLLRQLGYDDNGVAVMALSGGTAEGARRAATALGLSPAAAERAIATASAVGFNNSNATAALTLMAQNKSRALGGALAGQAGMNLVRQSAHELSGGNQQLEDNLMGGFSFNSRNAGRLDLGGERAGETMQQGWQRASVAQHAQSFGASMQAFSDEFSNDILTGNPGERSAAAVALAEMHSALPNATAENQIHINNALHRLGINYDLVDPSTGLPVTVEQQLANIANGSGASGQGYVQNGVIVPGPPPPGLQPVITANQIHGMARKYGAEPLSQRNLPPAAGGGGAGAGGQP